MVDKKQLPVQLLTWQYHLAQIQDLVEHCCLLKSIHTSVCNRVDVVQQALVSFTNVPVADQIVMFKGARLDPNRQLAAYKLPVVSKSLTCRLSMFTCILGIIIALTDS